MRDESCPMCATPLTGPGFLVDGACKHGRSWYRGPLLICEPCYRRGIPAPGARIIPPPATREAPDVRWSVLLGRGEELPPIPCAACGRMVVRGSDALLKRVTCSRSCSTSLTRTRSGGKGSGQPCGTCGEPITSGRADSRYCGSACRQKAYRRRKAHA